MSKRNGGNTNWRNRIVGSGEESPDQLMANPANFRIHPKAQQAALEGSLDTLGWIQQVLVNRQTQTVIDGHLRVALALRHNVPTVPVLYVDLSPEEEQQALLSLDPIAALAATDKAKLDELLHQVQSDDERVQQFLSELAEREGIDYGAPPPEDPGAQIDRAEELRQKWGVELGQKWLIANRHYCVCQDALNFDGFDFPLCDFVITDPPYDLENTQVFEIIDKWSNRAAILYGASKQTFGVNWNAVGWDYHFSLCWHHKQPRSSFPNLHIPIFYHQNVLYVARAGSKLDWNRGHDRGFGSVIELDEPDFYRSEHGHGKNPALFEKMMIGFVGEKVADPFMGSGSTLLACERQKRIFYGCEISPAMLAVALQRFQDNGLKIALLESCAQPEGIN